LPYPGDGRLRSSLSTAELRRDFPGGVARHMPSGDEVF
jgi:hypothetical protein